MTHSFVDKCTLLKANVAFSMYLYLLSLLPVHPSTCKISSILLPVSLSTHGVYPIILGNKHLASAIYGKTKRC
jgi:hypothetical protein